MQVSTLRLSSPIKVLIALWFIGEALAFVLIVHLLGIGGAFLLGLVTSLLGFSLLKRAGRSAMQTMRGRLNRTAPSGALVDDTLASFGALALLLPGFLSDLVGLALAVPAVRNRVAAQIARRGWRTGPGAARRHGPSEIDLDPEEWRQADPVARAMPKSRGADGT